MALTSEAKQPTRLSTAVFWTKATLLKIRRAAQDSAERIQRYPANEAVEYAYTIAESRSPLWSEDSQAERSLQIGKVQNLRCALRNLNGATIPAGEVFSFWKQIGRATPRRGYVRGRQLREGCLYPAVGGGLCQLSNALYDLALKSDCEIVERHPHTSIVPGSAAESGRDATVAWNYIDLRFSPTKPLRIEAFLTKDELVVRFFSLKALVTETRQAGFIPLTPVGKRPVLNVEQHSCASCGAESCFRHKEVHAPGRKSELLSELERTAYLMDERWPEFEQYLVETRIANDILAIPLDGKRWNQPRHAWDTSGYARVDAATWQTLARSYTSRRLGKYGAARLEAHLESAETLARRLAKELTPDTLHVCVAQSLLPTVWREGHLGGRRFTVVMTRLPLQVLHDRLDAALKIHPERKTLGEYRAPEWVVLAESEALAAADHIVTPHSDIAALFPGRTQKLSWKMPPASSASGGLAVAFPGPTAARKGAYELNEVARVLDLEVVLLGSELEGSDFWSGVRTRRVVPGAGNWLEGVGVVVQPALVEDRPRMLLAALSAGVPIIATAACGLGGMPGVVTVPYGDTEALQEAVEECLGLGRALETEQTELSHI
jgi:hypothetical protein